MIVAVPLDTAVIVPSDETVATLELLDDHVTVCTGGFTVTVQVSLFDVSSLLIAVTVAVELPEFATDNVIVSLLVLLTEIDSDELLSEMELTPDCTDTRPFEDTDTELLPLTSHVTELFETVPETRAFNW